jgi:pyruvate,orthophosphate dikinase
MTKYVYAFGEDIGSRAPKELLGGKGAGLFEMTRLGIPVPPGFTITTEASTHYARTGEPPPGLAEEVDAALEALEAAIGKRFGDPANPLLVSVRSGARASMPGMMDTILNLGLNDDTVAGLASASGDKRFALDAYRRLIEMYGDVVQQVDREHYDAALTAQKRALGEQTMADHELNVPALEKVVSEFQRITAEKTGAGFLQDVREQLWGAIAAVFRSWGNPRARRYRRMQDIPDDWGTAVNVQAMVFGNMGFDSGSGVCFTRNPSNGEKVLYGEFLPNAQGEDVVAGIRTPEPITARASVPGREDKSLERSMPRAFAEIVAFAERLERHFRDVQDIEFTIERDRVFVLQTRNAKRAPQAAVKIAVDLVEEGLLDEKRALLTVDPEALEQLLHDRLPAPDVLAKRGIQPIASGLPASPGAAIGSIVLDADEAEEAAKEGKAVILVRRETSPEDIHGMKAAAGILTATGGMTSHAAVVARGLGKCCVAGVASLTVDYEARTIAVRTESGALISMKPGDKITLDGTAGRLYQGELEVEPAATVPELDALLGWADRYRRLDVRANADTPRGAKQAFAYGARGIGLCRTEHMFFADERLEAVRCMVLSDEADRERWVGTIEPMQRGDFVEIFRAMGGHPVTIRLLDWPLHEFLPRETRELESVARALGLSVADVRTRALALHEVNPMLGHRGVRVGITAPTIYRMQVRAILGAALEVTESGTAVQPEIMIPVVALASELRAAVDLVRAEAEAMLAGKTLPYQVGTMIELPRACLVADELAQVAEFFSFGTNDLTQTTFGISRDDAGRFLPQYLGDSRGLLPSDPFVRLDERGVGELIQIAVERGRKTRADLKLGICGEHGGNPASIGFAEKLGLSYVSCSPPRLPVARLAAAQAAIRLER